MRDADTASEGGRLSSRLRAGGAGVVEGVTFWSFHVSMVLASEEESQELDEANKLGGVNADHLGLMRRSDETTEREYEARRPSQMGSVAEGKQGKAQNKEQTRDNGDEQRKTIGVNRQATCRQQRLRCEPKLKSYHAREQGTHLSRSKTVPRSFWTSQCLSNRDNRRKCAA